MLTDAIEREVWGTTRSMGPSTALGTSFLRLAGVVAAKDLRVELRSREVLYTMSFFAAVIVVVFSFAFVKDQRALVEAVPGVAWAAVVFAGTIGLGRAFDREREGDTMRALLLSPAPRLAVFAGKTVAIAALVFAVEAVVLPLCLLFFNVDLGAAVLHLALVLVLGAIGFSVVGTVFAAMLLRVRSRDVLLPVVLYPILVPMIMAGTKATSTLLAGATGDAWFWTQFLAAYDAIFVIVALWTFEALVIE
jgi:heme exporter protein B